MSKRYLIALVVLAFMVGPQSVSAQTTTASSTDSAAFRAQIQALLQQIQQLQQQIMTLIEQRKTSNNWQRPDVMVATTTPWQRPFVMHATSSFPGEGWSRGKIAERLCKIQARELRPGMQGDDVKDLQEILASHPEWGFVASSTGFFGPMTAKAVERFQAHFGLAAGSGGAVGPQTRGLLEKLCRRLGEDEQNGAGEDMWRPFADMMKPQGMPMWRGREDGPGSQQKPGMPPFGERGRGPGGDDDSDESEDSN